MASVYNPTKNTAFLHFIKTGGCWVQSILNQYNFQVIDITNNDGHVGAKDFIKNDIFTFGFIRHPVSWHISLFNFLNQNNWMDHNPKAFIHLKSKSIDEFLEKTFLDGIKMTDYYHDFFDIGGLNECSFIGKYENIYHDMKFIFDILGLPSDTIEPMKDIKINESVKYFNGKLSTKSLDLIFYSCEEIFKRFKYEI